MKKHTFVICAYKESEYLEECIKSIIAQRNTSEIIMVTSTPNTYITNMSKKYAIQLFINEGVSGITQDWEFGLSQVKTELATIAHQDDVYFSEYANKIIDACNEANHPIICFTDYYELRNGSYVRENKNLKIKRLLLTPLKIKTLQNSIFIRRRILSLGNPICCPSVTYKMDSIKRPFFLNHFKSNEDWEAWEKYSRLRGEFVYVNEPLMAHRIHKDSETSNIIGDDGRSMEDYEMYRKFWPDWIAKILVKRYKESEKSNIIS